MVLQCGDHSSPCYGPLQVTSADLASAAKPWASKCQICPVSVFWRLGELGDAWATVTLKTVFCFEAQILLSPSYMKPMVFNQGKVLLCVGASSFCSADLLSIFFSFIHGNLIDVSCRRRWEAEQIINRFKTLRMIWRASESSHHSWEWFFLLWQNCIYLQVDCLGPHKQVPFLYQSFWVCAS